jgi:hypothetical protein
MAGKAASMRENGMIVGVRKKGGLALKEMKGEQATLTSYFTRTTIALQDIPEPSEQMSGEQVNCRDATLSALHAMYGEITKRCLARKYQGARAVCLLPRLGCSYAESDGDVLLRNKVLLKS